MTDAIALAVVALCIVIAVGGLALFSLWDECPSDPVANPQPRSNRPGESREQAVAAVPTTRYAPTNQLPPPAVGVDQHTPAWMATDRPGTYAHRPGPRLLRTRCGWVIRQGDEYFGLILPVGQAVAFRNAVLCPRCFRHVPVIPGRPDRQRGVNGSCT